MVSQVLTREGLSRRIVFVVGRLQDRQAREIALSHQTKKDVIAANPKPKQGPVLD